MSNVWDTEVASGGAHHNEVELRNVLGEGAERAGGSEVRAGDN